jgi:hypothetical protein
MWTMGEVSDIETFRAQQSDCCLGNGIWLNGRPQLGFWPAARASLIALITYSVWAQLPSSNKLSPG